MTQHSNPSRVEIDILDLYYRRGRAILLQLFHPNSSLSPPAVGIAPRVASTAQTAQGDHHGISSEITGPDS